MQIFPTITAKHAYTAVVIVLFFVLGVTGTLIARNGGGEMAAATVTNGSGDRNEAIDRSTEATDLIAHAENPGLSSSVPRTRAGQVATRTGSNSHDEADASLRPETTASDGRSMGSGEASYYGGAFAGRPTANGETFDPDGLTAAHRTLPFGSKVRVTNSQNGRSVVVRINDRGPFIEHRLIDVSRGAAQRLGMIQSGTAHVRLELL